MNIGSKGFTNQYSPSSLLLKLKITEAATATFYAAELILSILTDSAC